MESKNLQAQQSAEIKTLTVALANEKAKVDNEKIQLRAELKLSQAAGARAKNFQLQQRTEFERLTKTLINKTVEVENERIANIKLRAEVQLIQTAAVKAKNFRVQQSAEAKKMQKQLTVQIEKLKIALANETANAENERSVNTQLRADLMNLSQAAANAETKTIQAQQNAEVKKLKVALSNETVNVENECNLKLEASAERLAK